MHRKSILNDIPDDAFISYVKTSVCCRDAMRKMGYRCVTGNANIAVKNRIKRLNIDVTHWNNDEKYLIRKTAISNNEYFQKGIARNGSGIRNRLIKYNLIEYKCALCGNTGLWNNKKLILQVDHINGEHDDNRLENLRFLCPNCHSQTDTYCGKNMSK